MKGQTYVSRMTPARLTLLAGMLAAAFVASACGPDLLLGARELQISPNPAQPGDAVSFVFILSVVPEQDYTIVAFIDGTEHVTVAGFEAIDAPFVVVVGAADDLITEYGLGTHTAYIEVRLKQGRTARTADVGFELREAPPPS